MFGKFLDDVTKPSRAIVQGAFRAAGDELQKELQKATVRATDQASVAFSDAVQRGLDEAALEVAKALARGEGEQAPATGLAAGGIFGAVSSGSSST